MGPKEASDDDRFEWTRLNQVDGFHGIPQCGGRLEIIIAHIYSDEV
jgi:hypothetical protein